MRQFSIAALFVLMAISDFAQTSTSATKSFVPNLMKKMTFPRNVGQIPIDYGHKKTGCPQRNEPTQKLRSSYLDVSNDPLYIFGHDLSYTSFNYSDVKLSNTRMTKGQPLKESVTVTNS